MVFHSLTKLCIIKYWTNIQSLRRFDIGLWQTKNHIEKTYRKFQYRDKFWGKFQNLPSFPRKMISAFAYQIWHYKAFNQYTTQKSWFSFLKDFINKFVGNSNIERKVLECSKVCLALSQIWLFLCRLGKFSRKKTWTNN